MSRDKRNRVAFKELSSTARVKSCREDRTASMKVSTRPQACFGCCSLTLVNDPPLIYALAVLGVLLALVD